MGAAGYLFDDWVKALAGSAIAITNEDSDYPTENLQNEIAALACRTTAKVAIKLQFDLGSNKQPQFFALVNHNLSGGTIDINSYTAADYATGKTTVEANKAVRALDMFHRESSAPTARRYWEIDLTNATSGDSYFEIGRLMVYTDRTAFTQVEDFTVTRGYSFLNIINKTYYGAIWAHKLAEKIERFGLTWGARSGVTTIGEIRTLMEAVYGNAHPFLFLPDITGTACHYVRLDEPTLEYVESWGTTMTGDMKLAMTAEVRGRA